MVILLPHLRRLLHLLEHRIPVVARRERGRALVVLERALPRERDGAAALRGVFVVLEREERRRVAARDAHELGRGRNVAVAVSAAAAEAQERERREGEERERTYDAANDGACVFGRGGGES